MYSKSCARCSPSLPTAPPKGLVIRSAKENGFIAGADIDGFTQLKTVDDAVALVKRGWDTFNELAAVPYPTLALIRGFCLGGGLELALACRYRVVVDEPGTRLGLPEVMLGIVPGMGRHAAPARLAGAPAALDLLLTGKTIDARRAKKLGIADECVPARIMMNTARGVLLAAPPPRRLPFPLSLTLNPLLRPIIAAQARKQVAARARREHYPAPYAILDLWVKYDGDALAPPPGDPASIAHLLQTPTAMNLIRVYKLQERLKNFGRDARIRGEARARRRRRHHGRRHRRVVRVARPYRHAAGPECRTPGARDGPRREAVHRPAQGSAARARRAGSTRARRRRATASRTPTSSSKRFSRISKPSSSSSSRSKRRPSRRRCWRPTRRAFRWSRSPRRSGNPARLIGLHFFNPVARMMLVEIVVGAQTQPALVPDRRARSCARSTSFRCR